MANRYLSSVFVIKGLQQVVEQSESCRLSKKAFISPDRISGGVHESNRSEVKLLQAKTALRCQ